MAVSPTANVPEGNVWSKPHTQRSLEIVVSAFSSFEPNEIGISFNGGKDSVVVVELMRHMVPMETLRRCHLFVLGEQDEFAEVGSFRGQYVSQRLPGMELVCVNSGACLRDNLAEVKRRYGIKAVFMGTRNCDPCARWQKLEVEPTTAGWPEMVRICPVFKWKFHEIWEFILQQRVPYCSLYVQGFTSLGSRQHTYRNAELRCTDGSFRPAWELKDTTTERAGRDVGCSGAHVSKPTPLRPSNGHIADTALSPL